MTKEQIFDAIKDEDEVDAAITSLINTVQR